MWCYHSNEKFLGKTFAWHYLNLGIFKKMQIFFEIFILANIGSKRVRTRTESGPGKDFHADGSHISWYNHGHHIVIV